MLSARSWKHSRLHPRASSLSSTIDTSLLLQAKRKWEEKHGHLYDKWYSHYRHAMYSIIQSAFDEGAPGLSKPHVRAGSPRAHSIACEHARAPAPLCSFCQGVKMRIIKQPTQLDLGRAYLFKAAGKLQVDMSATYLVGRT